MKKVFALFALMLFTVAANADTIVPKIGVDFAGNMDAKLFGTTQSLDTAMGYSIGAEYLHPINDLFTVGGGLQYQLSRKAENNTLAGQFNFLPIYATGMIMPFKDMQDIVPYGKLNLGYDFLMGDSDFASAGTLKGGIYWGIGIGAKFMKDFSTELMYSRYTGQDELTFGTIDVSASIISLNIGYAFDLGK